MVTTTPRWSEDVRRSYGVVTHPNFQTRPYVHVDSWTWRLHQLGVPWFRGLYAHNLPSVDRTITRARDLGLHWLATVYSENWSMTMAELETRLEDLATNAADVVYAIESVNEPNHERGGGPPLPDWDTRAAEVAATIVNKVRTDARLAHVVVLSSGLNNVTADPAADWQRLADAYTAAGVTVDAISLHHYSNGRFPTRRLGLHHRWATDALGPLPTWVTETGYQNALGDDRVGRNPVSEHAADQYAIRNVLDYLAAPSIEKVFRYQALNYDGDPNLDDAQANFGIFRTPQDAPTSWRGKPEYVTMKQFCDTLTDTAAAYSPAPISITVTPPPGEKVNWLVTEHSSGARHVWLRRPRVECWDIQARTDINVDPIPVVVHRPNWTRTINVGCRAVGFPIP